MSESIRVLVVDDSAFMRRAIARMLTADPDIEIVGSVGDGAQGLEAVKTLKPDVVTMDIEMPVMDGLTALKRIMDEVPLPVIMMSTLTQNGATATIQALSLGAFDFVPKPESSMIDVLGVEHELRDKVRAAATSRGRRRATSATVAPAPAAPKPAPAAPAAPKPVITRSQAQWPEVIAIGISTGGPPALQSVFEALPSDYPIGLVVVQHMPPGFTKPLAERLNRICGISIKEASDGDMVQPRQILIAPAGTHLVLKREGGGLKARLIDSSTTKTWHKPSVDVLFASVAQVVGSKSLAIVMTGMGNDGTAGAGAIKGQGGEIWSQDEASSVVYGMPRTVYEAGVVDRVLPLPSIPQALKSLVGMN